MKSRSLLLLGLLTFAAPARSQHVCPCSNVQTPAVPSPTNARLVSASCSSLNISWKGSPGAAFEVRVSYVDPRTHVRRDMDPITDVRSDGDQSYSVSIPVSAGSKVSWAIHAVEVKGGRTFYSYPLRGGQDYPIPVCPSGPEKNGALSTGNNFKANGSNLIAYPNPVHTILNIAFNKPASGILIRVFDVNGRTVLAQQAGSDNLKINVSSLNAGSYLAVLEETGGQALYTVRFVKE
jgi:hypothetical protein